MKTLKATHIGTCQACGSLQKLPGGVLAKHGYTVAWGFFSGTCAGSRNLPFELSTDFISTMIQGTRNSIAGTKAEIEALKTSEGPKVWMSVYRPATWAKGSKSGYVWQQVELLKETRTFGDGTEYAKFSYVTSEGKTVPVDAYSTPALDGYTSSAKTMAEAVAYFNGKRIKVLSARIAEMHAYIQWQEERVAKWTPGTLKEAK